jgi:hypothetical protein
VDQLIAARSVGQSASHPECQQLSIRHFERREKSRWDLPPPGRTKGYRIRNSSRQGVKLREGNKKNSYEFFLSLVIRTLRLGGFAGDLPRFGCNTSALLAPPACQNRYFQILKIAAPKGTADEIRHDQT